MVRPRGISLHTSESATPIARFPDRQLRSDLLIMAWPFRKLRLSRANTPFGATSTLIMLATSTTTMFRAASFSLPTRSCRISPDQPTRRLARIANSATWGSVAPPTGATSRRTDSNDRAPYLIVRIKIVSKTVRVATSAPFSFNRSSKCDGLRLAEISVRNFRTFSFRSASPSESAWLCCFCARVRRTEKSRTRWCHRQKTNKLPVNWSQRR